MRPLQFAMPWDFIVLGFGMVHFHGYSPNAAGGTDASVVVVTVFFWSMLCVTVDPS